VLWIAGLLAVLTAGLAGTARTQLRVAANIVESGKAEALADAGVSLAVMDLLAARRARDHVRRFPLSGRPVACSVPSEGVLAISVADEAGRIDVNTAGLPLLQALIAGLGAAPEDAQRLAQAIFDFRDADDERKQGGAETAEYRDAGLAWLPKNGPIQSLGELSQVHGLTLDLIASLEPFLATHSGLPGFDAAIARPELVSLIRRGRESAGSALASVPDFGETVALPAMFLSTSPQTAFSVRIVARTASGAIFVREALVDLGPRQQRVYTFRRWTRSLEPQTFEEESVISTQLVPC
jgi:general secretion pathway protein K